MAEAAISFTVQKLGDFVIQKMGFLQEVEGKVKSLKDALKRMQCFLKDAAEKQTNDERIRNWISDIREVAQDAEDVIETFILKVDNPRRSRGMLRRFVYFPNHVYHLNRVGEEINSIRTRLQDIEKSRLTYGIQDLGEGMDSSWRSKYVEVEQRRRLSHWQKDKDVVGLEADVELLLQKAILEDREGLSIATIVGMGGIGKSTLARIVYNHAAVADRFERRAWVSVSSEFNPKEIIKELVLQLLDTAEDKLKELETMEKLQKQGLLQRLHKCLQGRQYFIVLDDVWEDGHWDSLASAFPDEDKASRLVITSRTRGIPHCARYVHEMKLLDSNKSWELLLKKAPIDNTNGKCPQDLEIIGREILEKCGGVPLAITVVGGLLVTPGRSKSEWEKVLKGINSILGRSGSSPVSATLELSYHNLPSRLKSCFLCLGFFKEDSIISAEKLVQVWIAEGLVPEEEGEKRMEEIARSYLDELIRRNMVQIKDMTKDNLVKNCYIHDLLRELSIRKANEEISFEILRKEGSSQSLDKPRHRVIYCRGERFIYSKNPNKHVRSLFVHGAGNIGDVNPSYWKSFELLRVLDLEDFGLKNLPDTIGALIGLRYLGLRNNKLQDLPSSLGGLKNLQVLDVAKNLLVKVPNVIWELDSLRHLYMSRIKFKVPLKIHTLKNLQTLTYIQVDDWMPEHTTQMTSLHKLGIDLDVDSDVIELCTSLTKLENLVCLNLRFKDMESLDGLRILHRLTQLKLQGSLTKLPSASNFPPSLSYLTLVGTLLSQDPMPVLEKLPKLLYLKLDSAYYGAEMVISNEGFPRLEVLSLHCLWDLTNVKAGKRAMPELKRLEIYRCPHLKTLPEELRLKSNFQAPRNRIADDLPSIARLTIHPLLQFITDILEFK